MTSYPEENASNANPVMLTINIVVAHLASYSENDNIYLLRTW